ncbi:MAG TPA: dipeptidase PepE [Thermoanaerobaculia bacterium]
MTRRILLLGSSACHPTGFLDHAEPEIRDFFRGTRRVLFFPWALRDRDAYAAKVRERLGRMGFEVDSAHETPDAVRAVENAEAIFLGGGNTFRLLKTIYELDLLVPLRRRVREGMPYVGSSAGSNVACATIRSTNDMPIVEPPSLTALGLVPFNLNPHYLDPDPTSTHKGETREERIAQFHEENGEPVVGLREGAILRIEGGNASLRGIARARLFRKGEPPAEFSPGDRLDFLLGQE